MPSETDRIVDRTVFDTVAIFVNAELITFIGVASIPLLLFLRRDRLAQVDHGFILLVLGVTVIAVGAFLDYVHEVVLLSHVTALTSLSIWTHSDLLLALFFYLPGTLASGFGLASWLPALKRLENEVERRIQTEAELRNLAAELERLATRAEEADYAKSSFLASMSHELRTPLNAIIGFAEMIRQQMLGPIDNAKYVTYGEDISNSASYLLEIISDILDLSKIESGALELNESTFHIASAVTDCATLLSAQLLTKSLKLKMKLDLEVETLHADPRLFKQMIANLLSNAVKFSEPDGQIVIKAKSGEDGLSVSVIDSGIGMTASELERAVMPFAQIDNSYTRNQKGTGLGLAIVKEMVELHGGAFRLDSEPGVGTTATLTFPSGRLVRPKTAAESAIAVDARTAPPAQS